MKQPFQQSFLTAVMTPSNPVTLKRARSEEPIATKRSKIFDKENDPILQPVHFDNCEEDEDDDEDEDEIPSIARFLGQPGRAHPTSKKYLIYDEAFPTMISITARVWCSKYLKVLAHVDPDEYQVRRRGIFLVRLNR
jgi:hypothetical protein